MKTQTKPHGFETETQSKPKKTKDKDKDKDNINPLTPLQGDDVSSSEEVSDELQDSSASGEQTGLFPDLPPTEKPVKRKPPDTTSETSGEFDRLLTRWNEQGREVVHVRVPTDLQRRRFRELRKHYVLEEILGAVDKVKYNPFYAEQWHLPLERFLGDKFQEVFDSQPRVSAGSTNRNDRIHLPDRDSYVPADYTED